ncbi:MAG: ornithine cyclodeaminase family protein [Anaerolineales bacterium]
MQIRILTEEEVRLALPMGEAIQAMKEAFRQLSAGSASVPLRSRIDMANREAVALFMPALLHTTGDLAVKIVNVFPQNVQRELPTIHAVVVTIDPETGRLLALLEGGSLTAIRTGAASGAATDLLARSDARRVGIFGSGVQARTQLEAVCTVRDIEEAWVYSIDREGAQTFAEELAGKGPIPNEITVAAEPAEAVVAAEVVCTATTSSTPVFSGKDLRPGTHINAVGAYTPEMQELDEHAVEQAHVVVDSREAVLAEAGDLMIPIQKGLIREDHIRAELGEIVSGDAPGRSTDDQITLFKSVGVAVQDAAAAGLSLRRAEELGLGQIVEL